MRFLELNLSAKVHCCFVVVVVVVVVVVFFPLSFDVFMLWGRDLFDKKP